MSSRRPSRQTVKSIDSLRHENIFGGLVIGDTWVVMAIAHADRMGHVLPIRLRRAFFDATPGEVPPLGPIEQAIEECWNTMGGGHEYTYSRFLLCMPPGLTTSRRVTCTLSTHPAGAFRPARSTVTSRHVRECENRLCRDGIRPHWAVADLVPIDFTLDGNRHTTSPVGRQSDTLAAEAHLVLTDQEIARRTMDVLNTLGIRVDTMTSAQCAAAGNLAPSERVRETVLIDIDRQTTSCAFFDRDRVAHTDWFDGGAYEVLEGAAERLGTEPERLALWLNEREGLKLPCPGEDFNLPLFPAFSSGGISLVDLDLAARKAARGIADNVQRCIDDARRKCGTEPRRAVLCGDDVLTARSLMSVLYQRGLICEWRSAADTRTEQAAHLSVPGLHRLMGMMKTAAAHRTRQPYPEAYNEALFGRVSAGLTAKVRGTHEPRRDAKDARTKPRPRPRLAGALNSVLF